MKEIKYNSHEEASAGIQADIDSQPPVPRGSFVSNKPLNIHYFTEEGMDIDQWSGRRRFTDDHDGTWEGYNFIAFNKNNTKLHLSDYWGNNAGVYERKK